MNKQQRQLHMSKFTYGHHTQYNTPDKGSRKHRRAPVSRDADTLTEIVQTEGSGSNVIIHQHFHGERPHDHNYMYNGYDYSGSLLPYSNYNYPYYNPFNPHYHRHLQNQCNLLNAYNYYHDRNQPIARYSRY